MKLSCCSGLPLLVVLLSLSALSQGTKSQEPNTSGLVSFSGATTNAKAASWDDPIVVDGRVVRLRDVWVSASGLSGNSTALNLRIPEKKTPAVSEPTPQPPTASQKSRIGEEAPAIPTTAIA